MDNGMELRVKDYCAFCPDFEADVDKADIGNSKLTFPMTLWEYSPRLY